MKSCAYPITVDNFILEKNGGLWYNKYEYLEYEGSLAFICLTESDYEGRDQCEYRNYRQQK